MSTTSLEDKIQQAISEQLPIATDNQYGILSVSDKDFDIIDGVVSVKRPIGTACVVRISDITKKIVDGAIVLSVYTVSSLNVEIASLILSSDLLGYNKLVITDTYTYKNGTYSISIIKHTNKYVITIIQDASSDTALDMTLKCTDVLDNYSEEYNYTTGLSTDFIPTILSPTSPVYGARLPIVLDTLPENTDSVEFSVTVNSTKESITSSVHKNAERLDISSILTDTSYAYIGHIQKSAGTTDNIHMSRSTYMGEDVVVGISTSGHISITDKHTTTQWLQQDVFTSGTTVLDMISGYYDKDICHILTAYSDNDKDTYSIYKLDMTTMRVELVLVLPTLDVTPVKFNHDSIHIHGDHVLGVCCTDGHVVLLNNRIALVDELTLISTRIPGIQDTSIVVSMCMLGDDKLVVWYRYGYEIYDPSSMILVEQIKYDLGHSWLPFGDNISTIVHTDTELLYSTISGTYRSTDGITWVACHTPVYTIQPPTNSVIHITSVVVIDDVTNYYGCVTNHTPYPTGIVHTTDLIHYTYIPLNITTPSHLSITTLTGRDIYLPGYTILLTGCKYKVTVCARCNISGVWTDTTSKSIDVYA